ncbi:MAG TPA: ABC transporter permease, partial [Chthoniobacterales bacterium]
MLNDLRHSIRTLLRSPVFSVVAVLTLALGIGLNTAIFTVVDSVLGRPLPFSRPAELVRIFGTGPQLDQAPVSPANFLDWKQQNGVFDKIAAYTDEVFTLLGTETPERLRAERVSWDFFDLLGVTPVVGRAFVQEEDEYGRNQVLILSHEFWQTRFGGRADVVGQTLVLNDKPFAVVGVMPARFTFPDKRIQIWTPISFSPTEKALRDTNFLSVIARLKRGVTTAGASAGMNGLTKEVARQHPEINGGESVTLLALRDVIVGDVRPLLLILSGAVVFVLVICCANVANLLLARASARSREIAIRSALGASRARVMQLLLVESTLLGVVGGVCGWLLAVWGIDLLLAFRPANLPRLDEITLNWRILAFTGGVSLFSGLLFGFAPALQASTSPLNDMLKQADRTGTASGSQSRMRSILIGSEVALSLVLLIGAALLIRSLGRLIDVEPGFRAANVLTVSLPLSTSRYSDPPQQAGFYQRLLGQLRNIPGVGAAGVVTDLPLFGGSSTGFDVSGRPLSSPTDRPLTEFRAASGDYFRAMGIQLIAGRTFTEDDRAGAAPVAIINQTLARRYFGNENPIGKQIGLSRPIDWRQIVGVVADVRNYGLAADVKPECYLPYQQNSQDYLAGSAAWMVLVLHTESDPLSYVTAVKREIQLIDKDQPISSIKPMTAYLEDSIAQRRFNMLLLGLFAGLALVLALVGIYGVVSYS